MIPSTIGTSIKNTYDKSKDTRTLGEKAADKVANFAGSWVYIIGFLVYFFSWIIFNSVLAIQYHFKPFDPAPWIMLNLTLSFIAAIQPALIMMSQKRVEVRDRMRSENDYHVDTKAEQEIEQIQSKLISITKAIDNSSYRLKLIEDKTDIIINHQVKSGTHQKESSKLLAKHIKKYHDSDMK